jgi:hypothetical protein
MRIRWLLQLNSIGREVYESRFAMLNFNYDFDFVWFAKLFISLKAFNKSM